MYIATSRFRKALPILILLQALFFDLFAQDPVLPPTNLGMVNVYDGIAGKPGFAYQPYVQVFQTRGIYDAKGNKINTDLKINSVVALQQFLYLSKVRVLNGNLAFMVLLPAAQINASNGSAAAPSVNPKVWGDITTGTAVQWSDKKLFGKAFSHRMEFDVTFPTGSYNTKYAINPSAHLYTFGIYHAFTMLLDKKFSISSRNQFNYNTHIIGTKQHPGAFYNGNYSVDYSIIPSLKVQMAGYFLGQLTGDKYDGNSDYYKTEYGLTSTKERVLGYGPGLAYFLPGGGLMEAKAFFETKAQNRPAGFRPTVRVIVPLTK